jgi:hypothetical protein
MIDFIFAGILYMFLMFVIFSLFSFVTVAITYSAVTLVRRVMQRLRFQHQFVLK